MKFVVKLVAVLVIGLFTAPPFAEAQQTGKVWRIGYLAVAPNLYSNALTDTRFNNLRQLPEFQQLIAEHQRAGK